MRLLLAFCLSFTVSVSAVFAASADEKPPKAAKGKRPAGPVLGIKTPGVQIAIATLKAEAELPAPSKPDWIFFFESVYFPNKLKDGLEKIDLKTNKPGETITGLKNACTGMAPGFGSLWVPACGDGTLVRLDSKTLKVVATLPVGAPTVTGGIAVNADSVWMLTDAKTTLTRIDPEQNQVVSELRLPAGCKSLAFGETALWVACPSEDKVLRIDPATNLVDKRIEVAAQPESLAIGESSIWVFCKKTGKVDRIDPKTNKVSKSIDLGVTNVDGRIAIGEGSVWVTLAGFPITRINPTTETVVQQFSGNGGGVIQTSTGAVWLSNLNEGTVWRVDPKRIAATLAE